eukprot:99348-Chlamydomonas_euryale.AAC.1
MTQPSSASAQRRITGVRTHPSLSGATASAFAIAHAAMCGTSPSAADASARLARSLGPTGGFLAAACGHADGNSVPPSKPLYACSSGSWSSFATLSRPCSRQASDAAAGVPLLGAVGDDPQAAARLHTPPQQQQQQPQQHLPNGRSGASVAAMVPRAAWQRSS